MKKERIIIFPEYEDGQEQEGNISELTVTDFRSGEVYRIGRPSCAHYQYIHPVLDSGKISLKDLKGFRIIEDTLISVTSILSMTDGNRIAVLRQYQEEPFLNKYERIFAFVDMSVTRREIIPLDLETKRGLCLI